MISRASCVKCRFVFQDVIRTSRKPAIRAVPTPGGTGSLSLATIAMAVRFRKIAEARIDPERVTVRVMQAADGTPLGRVSTLAYGHSGIELMSTEDADPPIETALKLAAELAGFKEQDVDVVDPDDLWRAEWGKLDRL